jgi:uncharacterized protein (TIGR03437 family)
VRLAGAVPQQFTLHFPDLNSQDVPQTLVADSSGNFFIVANSQKAFAYAVPLGAIVEVANIHVTKTDGAGNALASFDFGGSSIDTPTAAAVDPSGNLVIVGITQSSDFPLVAPLQTSGRIFITKLDARLQNILFSTRFSTGPSAENENVTGVAVDAAGNIYVAGPTGVNSSLTTTPGVLQPSAPPAPADGTVSSAFVTELSPGGSKEIFSTYFGASGFTCSGPANPCLSPFPALSGPYIFTDPSAIALDGSGNIVIAGSTNANNLPFSSGAYAAQCNCTNMFPAGFVAKLSPGATQLVGGTYLPMMTQPPGVPDDIFSPTISAMALDSAGNVVLAGNSQPGFPVTTGALQTTYPVPQSAESIYSHGGFVAKLNASGSQLIFGTYLGDDVTSALNDPGAVAVDSSGTIWVTGSSPASALPAPPGTAVVGTNFIAGISPDGSSFASLFTAPNGSAGVGLAISSQGALAALGSSRAMLIGGSASGPSLMGIVGLGATSAYSAVCGLELVALYGIGIGPASALDEQVTNSVIGNSLGGVQVLFDGNPAALLYAGPNQINVIVPSSIVGRATTTVQIVTPSGTLNGPVLAVAPTVPQVLLNSSGNALVMNQDGTINSPTNGAAAGTIVTIWVIGAGATPSSPDNTLNPGPSANPFPVSVLTGNANQGTSSIEVEYAGDAPGLPSGVIQVNFQLSTQVYYEVEVGGATVSFSLNVID